MAPWAHNLRFALRRLRKTPGFTAVAILTLAFGIGATTAMFSIVEGVLLRPLPFAHPNSLVIVGDQFETSNVLPVPGVSGHEIATYQQNLSGFRSIGAYERDWIELNSAGDATQIAVARLSPEVLPLLGVSPLLGRAFTPQEDTQHAPVAILSFDLWHSRFHADPAILGQTLLLDRKPYQIIGVMPRTFEFPLVPGQLNQSQLWIPLSLSPADQADNSSWRWNLVGRLQPGVTPAAAQARAVPVANAIMRAFPAAMASLRIHPVVVRLDQATTAQARPLVRTLLLAAVVVLFIACANLASFLLIRVIRQSRETAVRLALGSHVSGILRQTLLETLLLSLSGGLLGLALAATTLRLGLHLLPETLPRISAIHLDPQVVGFALLLALLTGLACGILPAVAAARTPVNETLKQGGRSGSGGSATARLRSALVIAEIAVAMVLLVAAGLLLRSYQNLRSVDLGLQTSHQLTASYNLPRAQYATQSSVDSFNVRLLDRLRQLPGVQAVGLTSILPVANRDSSTSFYAEGFPTPKGEELTSGWLSMIEGDYIAAAGIPLLRGRDLTPADRAGAPLVVLVNRTLAQHFWPGQNPIGKRIHWGLPESPLPWLTVVGEVGDIKQTAADAPVRDQIYQPVSQARASFGSFASPGGIAGDGAAILLRTALPPEQTIPLLRDAVRSLDPRLPLTQLEPLRQLVDEGQAPRRFNTALLSAFAATAVLLAVLGIYSVIAFSAALRTQEMAIRLALGSQRRSIGQLILASGARLGLIGCLLGALLAVVVARLLHTLVFQVDPLDPAIILLAALALFLLCLVASLIPARRAASIEPRDALRAE